MLQSSNILGHERPVVIRLSFTTFVLGTVCLPLLGLITCVFISSVFHFDDSTGTHCQVPNYLPSISASISLSPECHIWRFCIGLHSAPRFLVAVTYFKFYKTRFASRSLESSLSCLNLAFSISENLGLLLLTYVSSNETYCYTLFALFEYLVVFSNMAFHLTAVWDFKSREVMVISFSEDKVF
eukprot:superscaffoldBa00002988_g15825